MRERYPHPPTQNIPVAVAYVQGGVFIQPGDPGEVCPSGGYSQGGGHPDRSYQGSTFCGLKNELYNIVITIYTSMYRGSKMSSQKVYKKFGCLVEVD